MLLSQNFAYLRKEFEISTKDMADLLKCTEETVNNYEAGKTDISVRRLALLAEYFGVTMDDFMYKDLSLIVHADVRKGGMKND
jgi:transcriptional regulator with XRE-family HTH domain